MLSKDNSPSAGDILWKFSDNYSWSNDESLLGSARTPKIPETPNMRVNHNKIGPREPILL